MTSPTEATTFKAVYQAPGLYDSVLPAHFFGGAEDTELVRQWMASHFGHPRRELTIAEFGCGTGRVSATLEPYAHRLLAVDSSKTMLDDFRTKLPRAEPLCADAREAVAELMADGHEGAFDVVGAFWSLSYPLGDCFEHMTEGGIDPIPNQAAATKQAQGFIRALVRLLAPNGHLLVLFFDSETLEQRLVTEAWHRIAPFPPGGRAHSRLTLLNELQDLENASQGCLTHTRTGGVALCPNEGAAISWFNQLHFKNLPALVTDVDVQAQIKSFIGEHKQPSGEVMIPSGVHIIDFHRIRGPHTHLPRS